MSYAQNPVDRAPYAIHRFGLPVQMVATLFELHRVLMGIEHEKTLARAGQNPNMYHEDIEDDLRVFDAQHVLREDLKSSWKIRWVYGSRLKNIIDYGWDGDVRPRGTPIPGTGKRVWCSQYRYPRTQSERRKNQPVLEDDEPVIRNARMAFALPNAWDDRPRRDWGTRTWKAFRRTRWKEVRD
jgi:hypothetical protein